MNFIIVCLILSAAVGISYLALFKGVNRSAKSILDLYNEYIKDEVLTIMSKIDFAKYVDFQSLKNDVLEKIDNDLCDDIEKMLNTALEDHAISKYARKYITREKILDFIHTNIYNNNYFSLLESKFVTEHRDEIENPEGNLPVMYDKDGNEFNYMDPENFFIDEENPELEPAEEEEIPASELANIIPPKEDADEDLFEEVNEDGLTQEEVEAGVHLDKNGRKRDKRGRFVK